MVPPDPQIVSNFADALQVAPETCPELLVAVDARFIRRQVYTAAHN
jgi:hypothetical protein